MTPRWMFRRGLCGGPAMDARWNVALLILSLGPQRSDQHFYRGREGGIRTPGLSVPNAAR